MNFLKNNNWRIIFSNNIPQEESERLFEKISNEEYQVVSELKHDHRSKVLRINLDGRDLVYKVPKEKNQRIWIRFLTWFRKGEAHKNIANMELLLDKNIKTTKPLLAAERRNNGMVVDSWLLYEYLDGKSALDRPETYDKVVEKLQELHHKGILHGDPQIRNFVTVDNEVYVIDANPKSVGISGFDRAYEWAYLRKSNPDIEKHFGKIKDWWLYKCAYHYDIYERKFTEKKRAFLNLIGLR